MTAAVRARALLEEAHALGVGLEDLIAAHDHATPAPTVAEFTAAIGATFGAATAATYRPYWRLAVGHLGSRRLDAVTIEDLVGGSTPPPLGPGGPVPTAAAGPHRRPASPPSERSSPEPSPPATSRPTLPPRSPSPVEPAAAAAPWTSTSSRN